MRHSLSLIFGTLFWAMSAYGTPASLTYQGRILKADGTPLEVSGVSFQFEIMSPSGSCVLHREQVNGIDMRNSKGMFDVKIGASHNYPSSPAWNLFDSFDNSKPLFCDGGVVYNPLLSDGRILRVQFFDGTSWRLISPDSVIRSVPYAGFSASSAKLAGHSVNEFLLKEEVNNNTSCAGGSFLTWNTSTQSFGCEAAPTGGGGGGGGGSVTNITSANSYLSIVNGSTTPQLTVNVGTVANTVAAGNDSRLVNALQNGAAAGGDLSGSYPNPTVSAIANVNVSINALASGQFLKYSGGQWINSGIATSDVSGMSSYLTQTAFNAALSPTASCGTSQTPYWNSLSNSFSCQNISVSAVSLSGPLPLAKIAAGGASNGQVLKWDGSAWAPATDEVATGAGSGTVTSVTGTGPLSVTNSTTTPVVSISQATSTTAGYLSATDWNNFNSKQSASTSLSGYGILDAVKNDGGTPALRTGTEAARPASASVGTVYFSSDTHKMFHYIGGSWALLSPLSSTIEVSGSVKAPEICIGADCRTTWPSGGGGGGSGTVTSVTGTAPISVSHGTTTPAISIATANTTTTGALSSADWNIFNNKLSTTLANGQVWVGSASNIAAARTLKITDIKSSVSGNWLAASAACPAGQTLTYLSASDNLSCQAYSLTSAQVTSALGYTPPSSAGVTSVATGSGLTGGTITTTGTISIANGGVTSAHIADGTIVNADIAGVDASKISGTLTTRLGLSELGLHVATKHDISTRTDSGFFQSDTPTTAEGWPVNGSWYHLMSSTHSNLANYYSMQFAGDFYNSNNLFYRSTNGNGATGWNRVYHSGNLTNLNQLANGPGYISGINSSMVTGALGYTPLGNTSLSGQGIAYNGAGGPQVYGAGGGASMISFHRPGAYAVNFGLDTDNVLKVGGWSMGGPFTLWHSGNFDPGSKLTLNVWNGSSYVHTDGRHYGTIYYDSNDTNFYMDPTGHSQINRIRTTSNWDGYQGGVMIHGNAPSITMQDTDSNIRWMFHNQDDQLRIYRANTAGGTDWAQKIIFAGDGNIWSSYIGDWIFNRLGQDVRAGAQPSFHNIWLGYTGTWLSDRLNQDVRTWATPSFGEVIVNQRVRRQDNGGVLELQGGIDQNGGGRIELGGSSSGIPGKIYITSRGPSGTAADIIFRRYDGSSFTNLAYIRGNGDLVVQGSNTTCTIGNGTSGTSCSSDERLKENIMPLDNALAKIRLLDGVEFIWGAKARHPGQPGMGVIAQKVKAVFPNSVTVDDEGYYQVDYSSLLAPLIQATKELDKKAQDQAREVASLKEDKRLLKQRLESLEEELTWIKKQLREAR